MISPQRDKSLIAALVAEVKACALFGPLLLVSDGFSAYVRAWHKAFRTPLRTGKRGRPPLLAWPGVVIGQVLKQRQRGRVVGVLPRLVQGTAEQLAALLPWGQVLNTAYIERVNATSTPRSGRAWVRWCDAAGRWRDSSRRCTGGCFW